MVTLGPSGAGNTTLVDILAQKPQSGRITGTISFPGATAPCIGFVLQQGILPPLLIVYEALSFSARLRLPESVSNSEKQLRVLYIMDRLGILDVKDSRMGWSDAGDMLILDEPTSGLDSVSVACVVKFIA
ncbi:ATP-binding cassette sub-family G member 2-like protein [Armillaria luteobubalina]|uniref:ATP-binding cassette sub-family G member 2-like protein n=1 Tax=Armillaria luteobubalina TaxID=153913 RepID=A0AA39QFY9_9AGAR|nr:ATP-binding cassette sub-family G member 2-like protein [Armillaria luteobubalina]